MNTARRPCAIKSRAGQWDARGDGGARGVGRGWVALAGNEWWGPGLAPRGCAVVVSRCCLTKKDLAAVPGLLVARDHAGPRAALWDSRVCGSAAEGCYRQSRNFLCPVLGASGDQGAGKEVEERLLPLLLPDHTSAWC